MARFERLADTVLDLLTDGHLYSRPLLKLMLTKGKANLDTQLGFPDDSGDIHADLDAYDGSQYECMDKDHARIRYFQQAAERASNGAGTVVAGEDPVTDSEEESNTTSRGGPARSWLEIGPGATGVLTRVVLDANSSNRVFAIEAVGPSVKRVRVALQEYGSKFLAVEGLAGKVPLPPGRSFDGLIAEILGHFGSSEGYVAILHQCAAAYPELTRTLKAAIPAYFGTCMVPVDLSSATSLRIAAIEKNITLFHRFPFNEVQLSPEHGYMELYHAFEELKDCGANGNRRNGKDARSFSCSWMLTTGTPRPFHGFGFYVVFGDNRDGPWTSSNVCEERYCSSWCNVFLPVGGGEWVCMDGDVTSCQITCHVGKSQPCYDYDVKLVRDGQVVNEQSLHVDYSDIICRFDTIRKWRQRERT